MAKTYIPAEDVHEALVDGVLTECHTDLVNAGMTFKLMFCEGGEDKEGCPTPALKDGGYVVAGLLVISPLRNRAAGIADVLIEIDWNEWKALTDKQGLALIDHLLAGVILSTDKDGEPKIDTTGRPKLVKRPYDFRILAFDDVLTRHGANAIQKDEIARAGASPAVQLLLAFAGAANTNTKQRKKAS